MPNRTGRQCAEHYKDRHTRAIAAPGREQLLAGPAFIALARLKVKHCKGVRVPKWDRVAADMSTEMGVKLAPEACKVLNKRLVKRLHRHGCPEGASAQVRERLAAPLHCSC